MGFAKIIKMAMLDKNMKIADMADKTNTKSGVLSVKLSRDNLSGKSIIEFADALDCDIAFVDRKTGKVYR